ncbi:uncharacterized protein LOC130258512 [Oenanthe melanoleuca]|uniref:uncharacterized protein LOC130258512 n=1 Tax=Oenanthe melanoleuca TaxID=2939378 RepID=UPI0024C10BD1|nr:uncharacterized protein LOC130258512 [Oenanthe melanoleuca]
METSEVIQQMLKEMQQGGQGMKGEAVQKQDAFPRGSTGSVPASAAGREAMPGTVTGGDVPRKNSPLSWLQKVLKPLEHPAGVSAGRTFPAPLLIATSKPSSHFRGPLRGENKPSGKKESHGSNDILEDTVKELQKGLDSAGTSTCVPGSQEGHGKGFLQDKRNCQELISGLLVLEFFCIVACIAIWNCWKRERHTSGQQMKDGGNTSH